jgi:superfamily I DNA/RNA helicase
MLEPWALELSSRGIPFINERGQSPWGSPTALSIARATMAIRENQPIAKQDLVKLVSGLPGRDKNYFSKGTFKGKLMIDVSNSEKLSYTNEHLTDMGLVLDRIKTEDITTIFSELGLEGRAYSITRIIQNLGSDILYTTPKIRLTTMHASKGRESDIVVVDLALSTRAVMAMRKNPKEIESERRLVYVALTRTKDALVLVRHKSDMGVLVGLPESVIPG